MRQFGHLLSYIFLRTGSFVLMRLPLGFSYFLAALIGHFANHVLHYRRQVVMDNLQTVFGSEKNVAELQAIAAESYRQTAMTFIELLIAPKLLKQNCNYLLPAQKDLLQELLAKNTGLVTISGHLGNWEILGAAAAAAIEAPLTVAAVQQSNPYINRFITRRRTGMGLRVAGTKEAMKLLIRTLNNRGAVGLVADQNAGIHAVFVNFFGRIAATQPGPARLALKFGAPLVVGAAIRTGPGKFKFLIQQVEIKENDTVETLTQQHVKVLEYFIRLHPEQYFWIHRRWKTRPPWELKI